MKDAILGWLRRRDTQCVQVVLQIVPEAAAETGGLSEPVEVGNIEWIDDYGTSGFQFIDGLVHDVNYFEIGIISVHQRTQDAKPGTVQTVTPEIETVVGLDAPGC